MDAAPAFVAFHRLVVADPALFAQLAAETENDAFFAAAVRLGRERGFDFTADDVKAALQAARRAWIERNLA
jgi:hypothetical protein